MVVPDEAASQNRTVNRTYHRERMMGYFKPLRRKFGVVTLIAAVAFLYNWIWCRFQSPPETTSQAVDFGRQRAIEFLTTVIPLTLLSALLLLSKPRAKAGAATAPASENT